MNNNLLFIIFTFIIIIVVIILSDNLTNAILIVSLIANFLIISTQFSQITKDTFVSKNNNNHVDDDIVDNEDLTKYHESIYGSDYDNWKLYQNQITDSMQPAVPGIACGDRDSSIDTAGVNLTIKRGGMRDQNQINGALLKNADFYKYHYGNELKESEDRPWWSRGEL